jgi:hypothetical protein
MVLSLVALFLALGGTAIAAKHYLITSTSQIKPSVLKSLKGNAGARGPEGPAGPAGAQGPAGPSNLSGLTIVTGPTVEVPAGKVGGAEAVCPAGSHAVSGGGFGSIVGLAASEMESNHQDWFIVISNEKLIGLKIHAEVLCAGAGQAVAASAPKVKHGTEMRQRIAQITAEKQASKN